MFRRFLNVSLVLSLCLSLSVFAQQPSAHEPSVERLRKDVTYLASDALDGRRTGTRGANDAADYIAGEFSRLGLRPGMQVARRDPRGVRARYLQPFPYVSKVELGNNNEVKFLRQSGFQGVQTLALGGEWMPLGFSSNARVAGWMKFVGYGINAAELNYNDYDGLNVSGGVALALAGTPDGENPHGRFGRYEDVRWKAIAARNAGAVALIVVALETNLTDDRLSKLRYDNSGDAGLPVLVISQQAVDKILGSPALKYMREIAAAKTQSTVPIISGHFNVTTDVVRRESPSFNVIGILPGSDPKLKDEAIVIGAHYDHLGRGGQGSLASREGEIHYGADDNASGTSGLLELARLFSTQRPKPRRTIVFIAFSGEEEGLIGSSYYVNNPVVPLANTVAMINLDMVGRMKDRRLTIGGMGTAAEWQSLVDATNATDVKIASINARGMPVPMRSDGAPLGNVDPSKKFDLTLNQDGFGPSDHSSFYGKQIPVLFFFTGTHTDYHKPSDTAEKINYDGLARITSFVANLVRDIDKSDARPTYKVAQVQAAQRSGGFRVYLGTIPNYGDSSDGMLLDGVRDDSPAAKAGLKAGDKIVKMAGKDVKNVYDYTYALGEMKGGQEYEVEVLRAGQRVTLKITPEARK